MNIPLSMRQSRHAARILGRVQVRRARTLMTRSRSGRATLPTAGAALTMPVVGCHCIDCTEPPITALDRVM